jgi:hypothetical protein
VSVYDPLHSLLDHKSLPFYYDERRISAHGLERCLSLESTLIHFWPWLWVEFSLLLRPTVSRSVCLGIKHTSEAYDSEPVRVTLRMPVNRQSVQNDAETFETHCQNFFSQLNSCGHSPYITSSLTRGWVCHLHLLLAIPSAFHFWVRVPWDSPSYFSVSDSRLPFLSPPTTQMIRSLSLM